MRVANLRYIFSILPSKTTSKMNPENNQKQQFAIRFGLGALKAVGFAVMEGAVKERQENGDFKDIYDFSSRLDAKSVNKKSIEALAKAGAFDCFTSNRREIAESFDILSNYANQQKEEALSNQMNLFGSIADSKPSLVKRENWTKVEKLQKEFEAFGFFLNEHPLDDSLSDLRKRGVVFSDKIERDEFEDGNLIKMAGVVAGSKHRSSAKGRFAYMYISDPFGIFEAMIFDEAIITNARDILVDGSKISFDCLVRKDDGGLRILIREVRKLEDFIRDVKPAAQDFEDIKKQTMRPRRFDGNKNNSSNSQNYSSNSSAKKEEKSDAEIKVSTKKAVEKVVIILENRDAIFSLKSFLATKISFDEKNSSKVFIEVEGKLVQLGKLYLLDENDVLNIKKIANLLVK